MSLRANPAAIGLFMIGGAILAIIGVATLASSTWFGSRHTFISYFDETVNGLERGAPVKFQGVPVGTVTELLIQIDQTDKTFRVPIQYEVDLQRLTTSVGAYLRLDQEPVLRQQIANGLRAQLQMESLVTGQLYIELSYRDDPAPPLLATSTVYPEIPTTPSLLAAFGTEAGSLVADVLQVLFRVNEMLEEIDMKGINTAVVASAQAVERLVGSDELVAAIGEVPEMAAQLNRTLVKMEELASRMSVAIDPLQSGMEGTFEETNLTLQAARAAIEDTRALLTTDSGLGYGLDQTHASLREAAEALRVLAISLDRTPDMLLRGSTPAER
jgi:paraquat-inducible protein B